MMSLKPGSQLDEPFQERSKETGHSLLDSRWSQSRPGVLQTTYIQDHQLATKDEGEDDGHAADDRSRTPVSNGEDHTLCSPPRTENEVEKDVGCFPTMVLLYKGAIRVLLPVGGHLAPPC